MRKTYSLIINLVKYYMIVFWGLEIINKERLSLVQNCIIAPNHVAAVDPFFIGSIIPVEIYYLAKVELFRNKAVGSILKFLNAIPVKRGMIDKAAIRFVTQILNKGHSILIFPEGTRKSASVKSGVGKFAMQLKKDILPIYIKNSPYFWKCFLRKEKLKIVIGEKIKAESFSNLDETKENYRSLAEHVLKKINELSNEC
ncbi:MAG: 1-acyl-sn-glycerol-3-phosphate acyltransferase [Candidatus Cloacimonetes bacterium]|nr:1-acyl-sn-glycerol-3-phosphate acyltransferase [Candidatus Cloacimonadota bacterium]MBL7148714.1 1-acyl-sn-glycerol-3-phosphate acyltransferase [Candidatus Cloacimonadota bacterium]